MEEKCNQVIHFFPQFRTLKFPLGQWNGEPSVHHQQQSEGIEPQCNGWFVFRSQKWQRHRIEEVHQRYVVISDKYTYEWAPEEQLIPTEGQWPDSTAIKYHPMTLWKPHTTVATPQIPLYEVDWCIWEYDGPTLIEIMSFAFPQIVSWASKPKDIISISVGLSYFHMRQSTSYSGTQGVATVVWSFHKVIGQYLIAVL